MPMSRHTADAQPRKTSRPYVPPPTTRMLYPLENRRKPRVAGGRGRRREGHSALGSPASAVRGEALHGIALRFKKSAKRRGLLLLSVVSERSGDPEIGNSNIWVPLGPS